MAAIGIRVPIKQKAKLEYLVSVAKSKKSITAEVIRVISKYQPENMVFLDRREMVGHHTVLLDDKLKTKVKQMAKKEKTSINNIILSLIETAYSKEVDNEGEN